MSAAICKYHPDDEMTVLSRSPKTDMKTTHTPGPWHLVRSRSDESMAIVPAVGFTICPLMPRKGFDQDIPNFQLISAAPDLLAQLKGLAEQLPSCGLVVPPNVTAAINKAEGTTP